jgi:CheY-like chemotaxis protein
VLVVDDNATNRKVLDVMLRHWGMSPSTADGGESGLAALEDARQQDRPFRLVLLDMNMPDRDGFAVIEEIRRRPELATATILMLTSRDRAGDVGRSNHALCFRGTRVIATPGKFLRHRRGSSFFARFDDAPAPMPIRVDDEAPAFVGRNGVPGRVRPSMTTSPSAGS